MEQGEVKNYTDTDKIDRIRHANAQRHLAPSSSAVNLKKQKKKVYAIHLLQFYSFFAKYFVIFTSTFIFWVKISLSIAKHAAQMCLYVTPLVS